MLYTYHGLAYVLQGAGSVITYEMLVVYSKFESHDTINEYHILVHQYQTKCNHDVNVTSWLIQTLLNHWNRFGLIRYGELVHSGLKQSAYVSQWWHVLIYGMDNYVDVSSLLYFSNMEIRSALVMVLSVWCVFPNTSLLNPSPSVGKTYLTRKTMINAFSRTTLAKRQ
jgi:hypothetical protein